LQAALSESELKEPAIWFPVSRINRRNYPLEVLLDVPATKPVSYTRFAGSPRIRPYSLAYSDLRQRIEDARHYANWPGPQGHFAVTQLIHYRMTKIKYHRSNHL